MAKRGRPTTFTQEIADYICEHLALGRSLRAICRDDQNMPAESTVRQWAAENREDFYTQYARSRDIGLDSMADQVMDIADGREGQEKDAQRDRLRFDARRWYLSKMAPKRYGEKQQHELSGPDGGPINLTDTERDQRILAILDRARARGTGPASDDEGVGAASRPADSGTGESG